MTKTACPETVQSEGYVSTAALFLLFSGSPKEEKSALRLPPAFRDLWQEFMDARKEKRDDGNQIVGGEARASQYFSKKNLGKFTAPIWLT